VSPKNTTTETSHNSGSAVLLAKPTLSKASGAQSTIYDDAVKEIVALSENDAYAKKIDNGPLSEARGKDTWRLHAQVRATDHLNINLEKHGAAIKTSLATLDDHLHTNTVATTSLVERHGTGLATGQHRVESNLTEALSKAQTSLNRNVKDTGAEINGNVATLQQTVKDSFAKLSKATAGTEENLRSQTNAFSKAVEELLVNVQNDLNRKIGEFRDEATRQVDKRFNQSDVAFAAIRADQEVIKALLTDIIKDRMGRSEPRSR
jgi:gas vesicle protein